MSESYRRKEFLVTEVQKLLQLHTYGWCMPKEKKK